MTNLIENTIDLVQKSSELLTQTGTNEIVKSASKGFFNWLSGIFTKNSAKEKLKLIEENNANQDTIAGLKANLEFILEDNEQLSKQLEQKLQELEKVYKTQLPTNSKTNNTSKIGENSNNNIVIQNINSGKDSNITINKQ